MKKGKKIFKLTTLGFTLIELLAVIILLAIISLIATPAMINVINSAKDKANLESVHAILDSARLYYSESMMDNNKRSNIENLNNIYNDVSVINKPDNGSLYINEKGLTAIAVVIGNKCYTKQFNSEIQISEDTTNCTLGYVGIDTTAPTVSFSVLDGTFNTNGWAKNNFNVNITISDNESGPSSYKYCIDTIDCEPIALVNNNTGFSEVNTESETNKVCVIGIDNYGNQSNVICSNNYKLDKTMPIAGTATISGTLGNNDWYTSDITVSVNNGTDTLSGHFDTVTDVNNITSNTAGTTINITTTDFAGNSATRSYIVKLDKDNPTINNLTVQDKNVTAILSDNFALTGYAITNDINQPSRWTTISGNTTSISDNLSSGDYYLHVIDASGRTALSSQFSIVDVIGNYWVLLPDGKTYHYDSAGTLLETTQTNGTFIVPKAGTYKLELHGGGGGGAGGAATEWQCGKGFAVGTGGGGSGEIYTVSLSKTSYSVVIGTGGTGGYGYSSGCYMCSATSGPGSTGGTTSFGSYSVAGGGGGQGSTLKTYSQSYGAGGTASGSLATEGGNYGCSNCIDCRTDNYPSTGFAGGTGGSTFGIYGTGGYGSSWGDTGIKGNDGAIKVTFIE